MEFDLSKKYCYYFKQISDIPRGSRNEKAISDYVVEFAKAHGYEYKQDDVYNVIVNKPASPGYEDAKPIILQAHMDMVCEKNKDTVHDFEKDPLDLYVDEKGWLHARGTTLGADDGQGVAYMLAILDDKDLKHPALQCAFTVMEEIGLLGAKNLKKEDFYAKRYINLDAGGEDQTCVTSSGAARACITKDLHFEDNDDPSYLLKIRGLKGGHSAACAHLERGNAISLAFRLMEELKEQYDDIRICDIDGGLKFNAIPRECDVAFSSKVSLNDLQSAIKPLADAIASELQHSDEGFYAVIEETDHFDQAISLADSNDIIDYLYVLPDGLRHRSMAIEGLSIASSNLGIIHIENGQLFIGDLMRSALKSHGDQMIRQFDLLSKQYSFDFKINDRYLGWNYEKDSELREILRGVLKERGIEMKEESTHGGLECGIFKGMIEDLDIITYGPISEGEHTPEEKLDLASFDRAYENLLKVLERCK